jgi:hypothetical protein
MKVEKIIVKSSVEFRTQQSGFLETLEEDGRHDFACYISCLYLGGFFRLLSWLSALDTAISCLYLSPFPTKARI